MSTQTVPLATPVAALRNAYFYCTQAGSPNTPDTGLTFAAADIQIVKNGTAAANSAGTVTEVSASAVPGLYFYQFTAAEISTPGPVTMYVVKTGVVSSPLTLQVLMPPDTMDAGTAQGGGAQTITLHAAASATDNLYQAARVAILGGTGQGQSRQIMVYKGSTQVATVDRAWVTNPDNTSVYVIISDQFPSEVVRVNIAQGGSSNTITLDAGASAINEAPGVSPGTVYIVAGTGAGQCAMAQSYNGGTKVLTIAQGAAWFTNPDATSVFVLLANTSGYITANAITSSSIASGAIVAGAFGAGAITAAAIAANAITAAAIASNAITAAKIASATLTSAKFDNTVNIGVSQTGTMQAGSTSTTAVLAAGASAVDSFYNTQRLFIVSGTGAGQSEVIASYVGATKTATVAGWATTPDNTSVYQILPNS